MSDAAVINRPTSAELREACLQLGDKLRELRTAEPEKRTPNWAVDLRQTTNELYAVDTEYTVALRMETPPEIRGVGPVAATGAQAALAEHRSAGQMFAENTDVQDWLKRTKGSGQSPTVEVERRTLITTSVSDTPAAGALLPKGQPFIAPGAIDRRRLFIRDMIAPGATTLNSVPYVRELNPRVNETSATGVAEGALKPEAVIQFVAVDAPVRTIASWVPITNQALEDMPTLQSYIDGRLAYMVMVSEEQSMLNGAGPNNLLGILNTVGVQTQAFSTDKPITIGLAIAKIELVDGEADGLAINPADFWAMVTTRSSNRFDGDAVGADSSTAPFGTPQLTVWGLPAVRTRAQPAGACTVGSWRLGAQVFDRSTVTISSTNSHADYFVYNKTVILAESRLALAVHRPDFFVTAAFS